MCFCDCVTTLFLAVNDVVYICFDDIICYYDDFSTFNFSAMTIDNTTCTNMGRESNVSGTIYRVCSNDAQTLYMQYKSGTAICIINCQRNTIRIVIRVLAAVLREYYFINSQGSSFNLQGFTFYFTSNRAVKTLNTSYYGKTTTRMAHGMSTTETSSGMNCVEDAYTYYVTVNVTDGDGDGIKSNIVKHVVIPHFVLYFK